MKIGPYEILGELGRGGMGVVYRARREDLGRDFALKVIADGPGAAPDSVARFRREARAAAALAGHPGVVGVHDVGEADGRVYFAMDLVEGRTLEAAIDAGHLAPRRAAAIVATVARTVAFAHGHGILHRDLKPANILLDRVGVPTEADAAAGQPRVTDFGLATITDVGPGAGRLTRSGQVLGTPAYMPPEQAEGRTADARADVYALGATLYDALVGEPPFRGDTALELLARAVREDAVAPSRRDPRVPPELDAIVLRCLEKRADARYPTALALAEDLERWLAGEPILARPPAWSRRAVRWAHRHRAPLAATVAAVLAAAGVGGVVGVRAWSEHGARLAADARRVAARPHLEAGSAELVRFAALASRRETPDDQLAAAAATAHEAFARAREADPAGPDGWLGAARVAMAMFDRPDAQRWCEGALRAAPHDGSALLLRGLLRLEAAAGARGAGGIAAPTNVGEAVQSAEADLAAATRALAGRPEAAYAEGLRLYAAGRYREAAPLLDAHARRRVVEPVPWRFASTAWLHAGDATAALDASAEALRVRPRDGRAYVVRGLARVVLGDLAGAEAEYDAAIALDPAAKEARLNRGGLRHQRGNLAGALADLDHVLTLEPRFAEALVNRAAVRADGGDPEGAIADCDRALAIGPPHPGIYTNRATARRARGDLDGAAADCAAALALAPGDPAALVARAALRQARGDLAGAIADCDAALRGDPRCMQALANRAHARLASGDARAALADTDAAIVLAPGTAGLHVDRGLARARLGDAAAALADYARALALDPRCRAAYTNRANLHVSQGDLAAALADYEAWLAIEPQAAHAWMGRGTVRQLQGNLPAARADLDAAITLDPGYGHAYNNRGAVRFLQGDPAGALADLDRGLALEPRDDLALANRGRLRHVGGDLDGALRDYDAALAIDPRNYRAAAGRAAIREARGDLPGAIADIEAALAAGPPNWPFRAQTQRALERLRAAPDRAR